jgi:hypothetical protein
MGYQFDTSAATPILKNRYTKSKIQTLAFKSAVLAIMPKDPEAGGNAYFGAMRSAIGSTASHTATTAFSSGSASVYNQWVCNYAQSYATANVSGDAVDRTKGEANALVDAMVSEFDGAFIDIGQMLGADLFGDGGGSFGQISATSNVGTATITLSQPSQIVNFNQGQILQASSDDGTGGAGVFTGTVTVSAVDINAGTITVSGASWTAGIASVAAGSYLFQNGNYAGAYPGFAGWLPAYNARGGLATPFNGVVRSADPTRLAGVAVNGQGAPKDVSLIRATSLTQRMGGRPDYVVLNPLDYSSIVTAATTRIQYTTVQSFDNAQLSFKAAELATEYGMLTLLTDVFCPVGTCYGLQLDTWLMPSMGEVPRVWGTGVDGLEWLRGTGDSFQLRVVARATTYCSAPGKNFVLTF